MPEKLLRELARQILGSEGEGVWKRIDLIGDIALLNLPFNFKKEKLKPVAEELLKRIPYLKSVWLKSSPIEGVYRTREKMEFLAGEKKSETVYREHGCSYLVDILKVYVSPRLSYEHLRVSSLVKEGETIVNMFAGFGPFSILIAKKRRPFLVYSIDINPYAYYYMVKNIEINKVNGLVEPILGDGIEITKKIKGVDRIIAPLPDLALDALSVALNSLKVKGVLHLYLHVREPKRDVNEVLSEFSSRARVIFWRVVRSIGPRKYQVAVDIEKSDN